VELDHEVLLHVPMRGAVPVAGIPYRLDVPDNLNVIIDPDGVVAITGSIDEGTVIAAESIECPGDLPGLDQASAAYPAWAVEADYLQVPAEALPLSGLALDLTEDEQALIDKVRAIERYLEQEYVYNLDAPPPDPAADAVTDFLQRRREGICTDFASSLAILCRLAGIPTRLVTGYSASEPDMGREGYLIAREKDAHAWVEVFVPEVGWTTFDPQAEREVSGSRLSRILNQLQRWWGDVAKILTANLLLIALLIPIAYMIAYQTRKRGGAEGGGGRGAGSALRAVTHALQPITGWHSPGTTPAEYLEYARERLPTDVHDEAAQVVEDLTEACYRQEEPSRAELRPLLKRSRGLVWRLRKIGVARWLRSRRPKGKAKRAA
jgi:hypothetical protein